MKSKKSVLIIGGILVVAAIVAVIYGVQYHHANCVKCFALPKINADVVRHFIESTGKWAFLVYIVLYVANTFSPFFPPIFIMSLSAGVLFGPVGGTIALTLGTWAGTTAAFFTARYLGRSWVEKLIKGKGKGADIYQKLSKNGFAILLPIRIIGFPPYGIIDFICGLSKMKYIEFTLATMIGAAPWIITQVLLADRFANFNPKDPVMWGLLIVFVLMIVITGKIVKKKQEKEDSAAA